MTAVRIEVTLARIAEGRRCSSTGCPIALSAVLVLPGLVDEVVHGAIILVDGRRLRLPTAARSFIRAFDSGCAVEPFAFEVEVP